MNRIALAYCALLVFGAATAAEDQPDLKGKYSGSYAFAGPVGETQLGVELTITSVEDGVVKGTLLHNSRGPCSGTYDMQGKIAQNRLRIRGKGGRAGDCTLYFDLEPQGNTLVGTTGGNKTPIVLRR